MRYAIWLIIFSVSCNLLGCGPSEKDVPKLIKDLQHEDSHTRSSAALSLASLGPTAKKATPALAQLLKDKNGGVRSSAAFALRAIGTKEALEAIDSYQK